MAEANLFKESESFRKQEATLNSQTANETRQMQIGYRNEGDQSGEEQNRDTSGKVGCVARVEMNPQGNGGKWLNPTSYMRAKAFEKQGAKALNTTNESEGDADRTSKQGRTKAARSKIAIVLSHVDTESVSLRHTKG